MDSNYYSTKKYETNDMFSDWKDLHFWKTGEWQVIRENLKHLKLKGISFCPSRENLFAALNLTPFPAVRCVVVGQDPYPSVRHATGVAFSVPSDVEDLPSTLINILKEYVEDTGYSWPKNGNLEAWAERGVLLLNATPSCQEGKPGSHSHWPEWPFFISEVVQRLSLEGGKVFALLGRRAQELDRLISDRNLTIHTSHPSPLGARSTTHPFLGSRLFTTINAKLVELEQEPIDWKLP